MTDEIKTNEKADAEPKQDSQAKATVPSKVVVTSSKTIDFPSLEWGIHAGETRELPVDEAERKIILASEFITIVK